MILGFVLIVISHVALTLADGVHPQYLDMLRASGQDEEFAKLMGIPDVSFVRASDERSATDMQFGGNPVSELGDILLTAEQTEKARQGIRFEKYGGSKWPYGVMPYWIYYPDFSSDEQERIHSAVKSLSDSLTNLKIRQWRSGDNDYVMVISGRGCYSNLGRIGNQQTLSLQRDGCLSTGTIQHEFIHAAGMVHEHMRSDRNNYVRVLYENIPAEWQSQYEKVSDSDFGIQGPYDYYSVMHYPYNAPGTNKPAFEVYDKNIYTQFIGQRWGTTRTDIDKVNKLYS